MKSILLPSLLFIYFFTCCCDKDADPPSNSTGNNNGNSSGTSNKAGVLFWTNNSNYLSNCGALTIQLNNGQQSNIVNYYTTAPANCVNVVGGYFYLDAGTYTYTVTGQRSCSIAGGSVSVIGNQCNLFRIQ